MTRDPNTAAKTAVEHRVQKFSVIRPAIEPLRAVTIAHPADVVAGGVHGGVGVVQVLLAGDVTLILTPPPLYFLYGESLVKYTGGVLG